MLIGILITLSLTFAIVANFIVLFDLKKITRIHNVTNVCIGNLAVSDILLVSFVLPQNVHDISYEEDFNESESLGNHMSQSLK